MENAENLKAYKGDFIDSDGALVLMGSNFIYGVKRDCTFRKTFKTGRAVKKNDFDMVGCYCYAEKFPKNTDNDSEWEEIITIKEIMRVADKPSEVDIKLERNRKEELKC